MVPGWEGSKSPEAVHIPGCLAGRLRMGKIEAIKVVAWRNDGETGWTSQDFYCIVITNYTFKLKKTEC
jgi:hypothetical protein